MDNSRGNLYHGGDEMFDDSPTSGNGVDDSQSDVDKLEAMSPEERELQRQEWAKELDKTEEEIQTLRQVLASKIRHSNDLKRKLGITVLGELRNDFRSSWQQMKESDTFQRTATAAKGAKERTSEITYNVASRFSQKWSVMRNSNTFKSFEERVGSAYTNVKTKTKDRIGGSRSAQNFDEALDEEEERQRKREEEEEKGEVGEKAQPAGNTGNPTANDASVSVS